MCWGGFESVGEGWRFLVPVRSGAVAGGICPGELRGIGIRGQRTGGTWRRGREEGGRLL